MGDDGVLKAAYRGGCRASQNLSSRAIRLWRHRPTSSGFVSLKTSTLLPKWARRPRSLDALLPVLSLRGLSTGDFQEALAALLGRDAPNLSPAVITRLTATWADEYARWQGRDLFRAPLRLRLGRRCLPAGADGGPGRVHARADRRDTRGPEGARRLPGRGPRERPELAGAARRRDAARHRTVRTKGALSVTTAKLMVFKLVMAASKTWRRLKGENQLPKVVAGVLFREGTEVVASPDHRAA